MNLKKILSALICTSAVGAISIPAVADVVVEYRSPTIVYEPAPREMRVWQEGRWDWNGYRYVWVPGHYVSVPAPERYAFRDRDRDGIPNWADRDIDGDGVPNRLDIAPYNPYRS